MELTISKMLNGSRGEVVISSREIAELTGKRHDNVVRDIKSQMNGDELKFEGIYLDSMNRERIEYLLPKNEALAIVSGYSFELRMKIINRLEELENRKPEMTLEQMFKHTIMLADERIKELEVENRIIGIQRDKAEESAYIARKETAKLIHDGKEYTSTELAKEIGFRSAQELNNKLNEKGIQFKQNKTWVLYARYSEQGLTKIKQVELESGKITYDRRWTGRGRKFILDLFDIEE